LLGGIWILQTLPTIVLGLFGRGFHPNDLLAGWFAGMLCGTPMSWSLKLKSAVFPLHMGGTMLASYAAIDALIVNLAVAAGLTVLLRSLGTALDFDSSK
jgi:solute:Na+ symporter, SSS family